MRGASGSGASNGKEAESKPCREGWFGSIAGGIGSGVGWGITGGGGGNGFGCGTICGGGGNGFG